MAEDNRAGAPKLTGKATAELCASLTDTDFARLGRRLFEYQECILPEGEKWQDMPEGEQLFWADSALRVVLELEKILGQSHDRDAGLP